jgi:hypothetical protein
MIPKRAAVPVQTAPALHPSSSLSCRLQILGFEAWGTSLTEEKAIWHVMVDDTQQRSLSKAKVLEFLRDDTPLTNKNAAK